MLLTDEIVERAEVLADKHQKNMVIMQDYSSGYCYIMTQEEHATVLTDDQVAVIIEPSGEEED